MSKKIGYIDEFGDKSIHFEKDGVTTFFIVSAIIIDEESVEQVREQFKKIASNYTQAPEIKSNSKAFRNIDKRINFLKDISTLDFRIYSIIVDKRKIFEESGLQFRNSFFKYINGLLDHELYDYYPYLKLVADNHGTDQFMEGFINYVESNHNQTELFRGPEFQFSDSKSEPLIQLADFITGSIAKCYEPGKVEQRSHEIPRILNRHILHLREWPENPPRLFRKIENEDENYNQELVDFIFFRINEYINANEEKTEIEIKNQLICLNYLIYRFKLDPYEYIYSDEIIDRIKIRDVNFNKRIFSKEIIGILRDNKILILSSQSGYKIPCCKGDLIRFFNNYSSQIMPMIETLRKTNVVIKSATSGNIDLLEENNYELLKEIIQVTANR
ncbi:DUF3800 domain-containing protein [Salinimicrobium sp. TH3]|uniref:DUF3800 domain-containing protein n=1 Tax=Salinimicrobium sp. TH3 TaxID=2997342 RepID=UPI002274B299|nr:DUF3800 domain-containing protein [Salinimicrobium sp. TH3]MCY2685605.1 DUF3800 domain-containing protein [Salinimicrobium sp. TH3]